MPACPWLMQPLEIAVLARLGVPYDDGMVAHAARDAAGRAMPDGVAAGFAQRHGDRPPIRAFDGDPGRLTEMDALAAYLQSLGRLTGVASGEGG